MAQQKSKAAPAATPYKSSRSDKPLQELVFGKKNYIFLGIGVLLIFFGFVLMSGGSMPSPDVWDESLIYSFRRITLAPIVVLSGLVVSGLAIFVKK